jgi:hypothetical protein
MTRINCGIPPKDLHSKHLIAEHREIKRIPNVIKSGRYSMKDQPKEFTLGTGHVKFFYDKLEFLKKRYVSLHSECLNRGFNVGNYIDAWDGIPDYLMNDYFPSSRDTKIVQERINEKLKNINK